MDTKLRKKLQDFNALRGWGKDHTGPHLARALMIEAAELNRLFQWGEEPIDGDDFENLSDELADIAIYLEYMFLFYNIDINAAIEKKIEKNAIKYPVGIR
jgi:NTP pyrophosphatase (non-canonical NTP hydrolase)